MWEREDGWRAGGEERLEWVYGGGAVDQLSLRWSPVWNQLQPGDQLFRPFLAQERAFSTLKEKKERDNGDNWEKGGNNQFSKWDH